MIDKKHPAAQNDDPICTTEQARFFLVRFMQRNFPDKSFEHYIHNCLAGDYAWQLAHAINSLPQSSPKAPDCQTCANRGHINGLSQETYCDSCMWYGAYWKKNNHNQRPESAP